MVINVDKTIIINHKSMNNINKLNNYQIKTNFSTFRINNCVKYLGIIINN